MQIVLCKIEKCGFRSVNGFCLKRTLTIDQNGNCKYLTKPGWDRVVEDFEKSTWFPPEEKEAIERIEEKSDGGQQDKESVELSDQELHVTARDE